MDEIQLAADHERGHVFTDRLLRARGTEETMFLGSDTVRPILKRLVPEAEIISRPRFSILSFAGDSKLHRLPRRSVVVAFSAAEVYTLAEVIRRQKGGAAVVLGALSPRTRNAQVAMYQAGEVEHLVATDAIGMGLNMDVAHVAFAGVSKFDGNEHRRLRAPEMAQIAGRAGRHMANGTFGATNGCEPFEPREIEAIENHTFPPLKCLRWRNSELDFASLEALTASLDCAPGLDCLVKVRNAIDHRSLLFLSRRDEVRAALASEERLRLLWQVCQIPDFRKTLTDAHLHLLATVFKHLTGPRAVLPNDWVGSMLAQLERFDGDIDALVTRIAHVRTWTYMSHRASWLQDAAHWQGRAREVEDRLSDALHQRLTQRFVDRRTSALMRSLRDRDEHAAVVDSQGEVVVDGHVVGRIEGLNLTIVDSSLETDRRLLSTAARRAALPALRRRVAELVATADVDLTLGPDDTIRWQEAPVARLRQGTAVSAPRLEPLFDPTLDVGTQERVRQRLTRWRDAWMESRLAPLAAAAGRLARERPERSRTGHRLSARRAAGNHAAGGGRKPDPGLARRRPTRPDPARRPLWSASSVRAGTAQAGGERGPVPLAADLPWANCTVAAAGTHRRTIFRADAGRGHAGCRIRDLRRIRRSGRHSRAPRRANSCPGSRQFDV